MLTGKSLGRYEILELLGEGGMGVVYRAHDTQLRREVAVKVLREDAVSEPKRIERFEREARAVARLSHPNILEIFDFGHDQGVDYAVMELLEGETLRHRLVRSKLPMRKLIQVAEKVADGLGAAHREGVIHRDLKPENIFLTSDGRVKILDFGVAHLRSPPKKETDPTAVTEALTDSGTIVGTLSYMSPEQIRGREVTAQSDIFALGCVLYEMICRRQAFPGGTTAETVAAILEEDPPPLSGMINDLPFTLDQIVSRCLEKQPADRYESARDVAFALNGAAEAMKSGSASQPRPVVKGWRSPRTAAWAFGGTFVAAAVAVGIWFTGPESVPLPEEKHLAVIGFESATNEPGLQRFAGGLTETVADGVTLLEEQTMGTLWVVPRTLRSSIDRDSIEALRSQYNINLAIKGRLERQGDQVRLSLGLIDAETTKVLRSSAIEDNLSNLSSFQVMPLHRIAEMLGVELTRETRERVAATSTNITAAFYPFIQARGLLKPNQNPSELETAIDLLRDAVREDPLFGAARESLAIAYLKKFYENSDDRWIELGRGELYQAIARNPTASAYVVLTALDQTEGDSEGAVSALEEAAQLAPASGTIQSALGDAYQAVQRIDDARRAYQKAINRRPGFMYDHYALAFFYYRLGELDSAANEFRQVIRFAPDNYRGYNALGGILYALGRRNEATERFEASIEAEPVENYVAFSNLGTIYYDEARFADAAEMYMRALERDDSDYVVWGNLGFAYAYGSDPGQADGAFKKAIELGESMLEGLRTDPTLLSDLASYHAWTGNRVTALEMQNAAITQNPTDLAVLSTIGETYEVLGDRDRGLEWIGLALQAGAEPREIETNPTLRGLVADERYQALVVPFTENAAESTDGIPAGS